MQHYEMFRKTNPLSKLHLFRVYNNDTQATPTDPVLSSLLLTLNRYLFAHRERIPASKWMFTVTNKTSEKYAKFVQPISRHV